VKTARERRYRALYRHTPYFLQTDGAAGAEQPQKKLKQRANGTK
jgi:hypothetical protein